MNTAFSLTWLADVLRAAGLKVVEQPGWKTRGHGPMGKVRGIICHHTAGPKSGNMPSLKVITEGRPDLDGPLCQLGLGRDGTWFIIAAGRGHHAGPGSFRGITAGSLSFIGIEAENQGIPADPWPAVQVESYKRGCAAVLKKLGADVSMCIGHKEWATPRGRKIDPSFDMDDFRAAVKAIMAGGSGTLPPIPAGDGRNRPTLRRGDRGDAVKLVQAKVGVEEDGIFGPVTEAAVREFQRSHDLVPDGIVGPATWAALSPIAAPSPPPPPAGADDRYVALFARVAGRTADDTIRTVAHSFAQHAPAFGQDKTKPRIAEFVAQIANETGGFRLFHENLNYSAKRIMQVWPKRVRNMAEAAPLAHNPEALANVVYQRPKEGNTQPGDGWRYRGRGALQLTFRNNYRYFGQLLGIDLEGKPDLAADPAVSVLIALQFFKVGKVNAAIDRGDFREARRITNGAALGLKEVARLRAKALAFLG